MNFCGNSIKRQRKPQTAINNKSGVGANSRIQSSSGDLFEGVLLTICSSRVRLLRGGLFQGGGAIRGFTVLVKEQ